MRNHRTENAVCLDMKKKTWKFVFLTVLAVGSLLLEKRTGKQTLTEVQIETKDGPLYRVLAIDGTALNPDQRQQDDARIGRLMKDPRSLLKLKQAQAEDEAKPEKLINLMPGPFVSAYIEGNTIFSLT